MPPVNNKFKIIGNIVTGETNQGDIFLIDIEDFDIIRGFSWWTDKDGYISTQHKSKNIKIHQMFYTLDDGKVIDHINNDKCDNRRSNLRRASIKQNCYNKTLNKRNTSGITGVSWSERNNKWRARIGIDNKRICLGFYSNIEDAIVARLKAEKEYFKDFSPQSHLFEKYGIT